MNNESPFPTPSQNSRKAALTRQLKLTKPTGSLGRLEEIAVSLAAWLDEPIPKCRPAVALLFAADHGVSRLGVSAYPREVTRAMVQNFLTGGAAASILSRKLQVPLTVIDVGVDGGKLNWSGPEYVRADVADHDSGDLVTTDAMRETTLSAAIMAGQGAVRDLAVDTRVIVLGEMGIGNTTVASALAAGLVGQDPDAWVGHGTGVHGPALQAKRDVVRSALARVGKNRSPRELLQRLGGREMAAMVGAMIEAARLRRIVLVDGFIVSVAALAAVRLEPRSRPAMIFAHCSAEGAHARLLEILGARPLLELNLRLGEGSGALVALGLLDLACSLHSEMATFDSAGVPDRGDL